MAQSWKLDDARPRALENPHTFYKPSDEVISQLKPGDLAKLIFLLENPGSDEPEAERMWVVITDREGDRFSGLLDNDPSYIRDLAYKAPVVFEAKHIIDTSLTDPVPDPTEKWWGRCFASRVVVARQAKIGYFYRESPDRDDDSGWRFLAGGESQDDISNPENVLYVAVGAVLNWDNRVIPYLDLPAPVALTWDERVGSFVKTAPTEPF